MTDPAHPTSESSFRRRRRRGRGALWAAVLLSLAAHLPLVVLGGAWLLRPVEPPERLTLELREPPAPQPPAPPARRPDPRGQVVDAPPTARTDPPPDTRRRSRQDTAVEREMVARAPPLELPSAPRLSVPARPQPSQAAPAPRDETPLPESEEAEDRAPAAEAARMTSGQAEDEKARRAPGRSDLLPDLASMQQYAGAPPPEYLPEVEAGTETHLNSRRSRYAAYMLALRERVGPIWYRNSVRELVTYDVTQTSYGRGDRISTVHVEISRTGALEVVRLLESSGIPMLDEAAVTAFRTIGHFEAPPPELLDARGKLVFPFAFIMSLDGPPKPGDPVARPRSSRPRRR